MAGKSKRTSKRSNGVHGSTRTRLTAVQKVNLGGGQLSSMREIGTRPPKTEEAAK